MINDFTIVIQGRCEKEQIQLWIDNYSEWNVIVSTWNDFDLDIKFPQNWKIVKSEYPTFTFDCQNLEKQVVSTLTGLKEVNTEYVIKVRGDEYFSKLDLVYKRMKQNLPKVLCSSLFFRPLWLYHFHISDHFICCKTEDLKLMFEKCLELFSNVTRFNRSSMMITINNYEMYEEQQLLVNYSRRSPDSTSLDVARCCCSFIS